MGKKTQKDRIRRDLLKGRSITQFEAVIRHRCIRLSAIIYELRHFEGIPIITEMPRAKVGKPFAVYSIDKEWLRKYEKGKKDRKCSR